MPAKSKRQFHKMFVLEEKGKISSATRHEFTDSVDYSKLPETAGKRKPPPRKKHK